MDPFRLLCKFQLSENIFGRLNDYLLQNDFFFITNPKESTIKIYPLSLLIQRYQTKEPALAFTEDGYDDTLTFHEMPEPMYVISAAQKCEEIGGCPFIFIYRKDIKRPLYNISSFVTGDPVENGEISVLENTFSSNEFYLYDDFNRLLLKTPNTLFVYHVESASTPGISSDENPLKLVLDYEISASNPYGQAEPNISQMEITPTEIAQTVEEVGKTRGGRLVKKLKNEAYLAELSDDTIVCVDYEDELDLLVVGMYKSAYLYRNSDGKFLKRISLGAYWVTEGENYIILDKNHLVLLTNNLNNRFYSIYILKLRYEAVQEEVEIIETVNIVKDSPDYYDGDSDYSETM